MRRLAWIVASCGLVLGLAAGARGEGISSGLKAGQDVPTFNVVDITGPNKEKPGLCYT
jgi:hypothetical protein